MNLNKEKLSSGKKDPRRKEWIKQRTKRGYSDRDIWNFDSFLAQVIAGGVRQVRRFGGHPAGMSAQEWVDICNFIADQFEWYAKEQFSFSAEFSDGVENPNGDFHKAWVLLEKNFGGLWA